MLHRKHIFIIAFLYGIFIDIKALDFKVASYNPENAFDLKKDGTEYKEYNPSFKGWDQKAFNKKISNITKVINDINADIIVLEEIENRSVLLNLIAKTKYKYFVFDKKPQASIGIAILSKFPITSSEIIESDKKAIFERNILKANIKIDGKNFIIYANHWRSKKTPESKRVKSAMALQGYLKKHKNSDDYIIAGDLNSNYDEFITFKYDKLLNDTYGITGINQVLNTTYNGNFIEKEDLLKYKDIVHFNPWLELKKDQRYSTKFKGENNTPDHIILSQNLFDNQGISYKENSFMVFKSDYLFKKNGAIKRWDHKKKDGFSDHLPVVASFTTNKILNNSTPKSAYYFERNENKKIKIKNISDLYEITTLNEPVVFNNVLVTYKSDKIVVLKGQNDRSIQYYGDTSIFENGYMYDIKIFEIDDYNGNKEIKKLEILRKTIRVSNIKDFYINGTSIDLFNSKYQNEIVTNLKGIYKKGHLHYQNNKGKQKIKVYFKKDMAKPKDQTMLEIKNGIIATYKSKPQIAINKTEDYKILIKNNI